MFRGREMAHTELGEALLQRVLRAIEGKVVQGHTDGNVLSNAKAYPDYQGSRL